MTGPRLLVVHNADSDPVGAARRLARPTPAPSSTVVDGPDAARPTCPASTGWSCSAAPMGANDDATAPWLPHERALLREAVSDELPTLGICLGAQLLAAANGGRVDRQSRGPGDRRAAGRQARGGGDRPAVRGRCRSRPTCCSGTSTRSSRCRPARSTWPARRCARTRPSGSAGSRGASSSTSRRRRSWCASLGRRGRGRARRPRPRPHREPRRWPSHDDIAEVWAPFAAAFVDDRRRPGRGAAPRAACATSTAAPVTDPAAIRAALAAEAHGRPRAAADARAAPAGWLSRRPRAVDAGRRRRTAARSAARLSRFSFDDGAARGRAAVGRRRCAGGTCDANAADRRRGRGRRSPRSAARADPDGALDALAEIVGHAPTARAARGRSRPTPTCAPGCSRCSASPPSSAAHLRTHPDDWTVLLGELDPAGAAQRLAAAVGADADDPVTGTGGTARRASPAPTRSTALRDAYRRELMADRRARPRRRPRPARRHRAAGRPRRAHAAGRARRRRRRAARRRRAVPAGGHRHGQGRLARAELRLRRRRRVRRPNRGGRADDADDATRALATATGWPARLMRLCRVGGLGGRRQPAPRGQGRRAGAHAGQPRGVLRALGQHLGVPGAAQGAADRRRPRARPRLRRRRSQPLVWTAAERPGFVAGRAGDAPPGRRAHPGRPSPSATSSSAAAACATSSSRCSCCSSCTAAATRPLRTPETLPALDALRDGGYVGRDDARQPDRRLPLPARHRAPAAAAPAAAHARAARRRTSTCVWLAQAMGYRPDRRGDARAVFRGRVGPARPRGAPAAREAVLPAAARGGRARAVGGSAAHAGRGRAAAGRARLRRPGGRAAAHRVADRRAVAGGPRCSARCCRCCSPTSPTRPIPTPGCWPTAACPTSSARRRGTCACCATATPSSSRLAYVLGVSRYVAAHARPRARGAAHARRRPTTLQPRAAGRARVGACASRRPATATRRRRWPRCAACAARSCCAPRSPTCSATSTSTTWAAR